MLLLKRCRFIVTYDPRVNDIVVLRDSDILVSDEGLIECVGACKGTGEEIDCSSFIAIPGLVNAHTHAAMVLLRGFCDDIELHKWLEHMWSVERSLTKDVVEAASELAVMEMVSTGITAFIDMYFEPEVTAAIAERFGVRVALGPVFIDPMRNPGKVIEEFVRFARRFEGSKLVKPIVNVHSIYTCSKETIVEAYRLAREYNTLLHIHVSETRREVYECRKRTGMFPVEYLASLGVLDSHTHLANLGWVTSWEIEAIHERGCSVVHCPSSNMKLATAGFFPFYEMMAKGIRVTIGTDGAASNNTLDLIREMRIAVLLQRHGYWDTRIKAKHVFIAATYNGYRVLGLKGGCIREGYIADIVLLDADSIYLQPLRHDNVLSAIVYSASGRDVVATIVNGRLVYWRDRDLPAWRARASKLVEKLNKFMERFIK